MPSATLAHGGEGDRARRRQAQGAESGHIYDVGLHGVGTVEPNGDGELKAPDEDVVDR